MTWPLVSICIPVYNCRPFIERSVHSALTQDYPNFELIICDDNSIDGTWEYLQSLDDPRVRLFRNRKNLGQFGNHNQSVSHAKGEFIKFLHADDELPPTSLSSMVPWLLSYPSAVASVVPIVYIDENSEVRGKSPSVKEPLLISGHELLKRIANKLNIVGCTGNILLRKRSYEAVGGMQRHFIYCGDVDLFARLGTIGDWIFLPWAAYLYRHMNKTSTCYKYNTCKLSVVVMKEQLSIAISDGIKSYGLLKNEIKKWQAIICARGILEGLSFYLRQGQSDLLREAFSEANKRTLLVITFCQMLAKELPSSLRYVYFRYRTGCGYKSGEIQKIDGTKIENKFI